jgi:Ran GTPase-activating protein (RanGAP) involved in mRNA processing and transport
VAKCVGYNQNSIVELGLGNNNISAAGMTILGPTLTNQKHLKVLQLQCNPIGDAGASTIFAAIRDNKIIETLNLCQCDLNRCPWASKLQIIDSLTNLNLSNNKINDDGFRSLCNSLENCFSLRYLDLSNNIFNGKFFEYFFKNNKSR